MELKSSLLNAVVSLADETATAGFGALVFCSGRQSCQNMAALISEAISVESFTDDMLDRRKDVLTELRSLPVGLDATLSKTIIRGVAFHREFLLCVYESFGKHSKYELILLDAGLTAEERDVIAEAYDNGIIRVIVATCSLAAGINLPARRVILQGARMGRDLIGPAMLYAFKGSYLSTLTRSQASNARQSRSQGQR